MAQTELLKFRVYSVRPIQFLLISGEKGKDKNSNNNNIFYGFCLRWVYLTLISVSNKIREAFRIENFRSVSFSSYAPVCTLQSCTKENTVQTAPFTLKTNLQIQY